MNVIFCKEEGRSLKYPCLRQAGGSDLVVLFTDRSNGMAIRNSNHSTWSLFFPMGHWLPADPEHWIPFNGTITLSKD